MHGRRCAGSLDRGAGAAHRGLEAELLNLHLLRLVLALLGLQLALELREAILEPVLRMQAWHRCGGTSDEAEDSQPEHRF